MRLVWGGGAFTWWSHKRNWPAPMWVSLAVRCGFSTDESEETIKELDTKRHDPERLRGVVNDVGLMEKWNLSSEREAVQKLSGVVFVRMGDMNTPAGIVPAVPIGAAGKARIREISGQIAERLMKDVREILDVHPLPLE